MTVRTATEALAWIREAGIATAGALQTPAFVDETVGAQVRTQEERAVGVAPEEALDARLVAGMEEDPRHGGVDGVSYHGLTPSCGGGLDARAGSGRIRDRVAGLRSGSGGRPLQIRTSGRVGLGQTASLRSFWPRSGPGSLRSRWVLRSEMVVGDSFAKFAKF